MTSVDYSQIRRQLEELKLDTAASVRQESKTPACDFGLFILLYLGALVLAATAMLAAGLPLQQYTVLYAVPVAWGLLALLRKAPLYTLMIAAAGLLFLAAVSLLAAQVFDTLPESGRYYKLSVGMLASGWNPFRQTMSEFASTAANLPANAQWLAPQMAHQPLAPFLIGAGIDALTGNITYGKVFNIAGIAATLCITVPMLRNAFKLSRIAAFAAVLLAAVNPVTLGQAFSYYSNGFAFQMLTVAAAAFVYMAYKPDGRYARTAKVSAFAAVCLAINSQASAALFAVAICLVYVIVRVVAITKSDDSRLRQLLELVLYFTAMAVTAVCILGAATYIANVLQNGNPVYGMYSTVFRNMRLDALIAADTQALPPVMLFLVSLLSPISAAPISRAVMKIPFTFSSAELALASPDAAAGGWGVLFSGIFVLSLIVIIISAVVLIIRRSRKAVILIVSLLSLLPVAFMPYLFIASRYLLLFWLPLIALCCLFAAHKRKFWMNLLAAALCLLLVLNCVTAYNALLEQAQETKDSRTAIAAIIDADGQTADIAPLAEEAYQGMLFNLQDEGAEGYTFTAQIPEEATGQILQFLTYRLRDEAGDAEADAAGN